MINHKSLWAICLFIAIMAISGGECLAAETPTVETPTVETPTVGTPTVGTPATEISTPGVIESLLPAQQEIVLLVGTSRVLATPSVQRVQVASPAIADVMVASTQEIIIIGVAPGITTLHTWTKDRLTSYNIRVVSDMAGVVQDMLRILNDPDIKITSYKNTVLILTGTVATPARKERAVTLAKAFSSAVVDLITVVAADPVAQPDVDLASVAAEAIAEPNVITRMVGKTLFLEGTVPSNLAKERAQRIAEALAPIVVNLIQVERVEVIRGTTVEQPSTVISSSTTASAQ